eukprot:6211975-Pleurochrysis_carterae.AAC.1
MEARGERTEEYASDYLEQDFGGTHTMFRNAKLHLESWGKKLVEHIPNKSSRRRGNWQQRRRWRDRKFAHTEVAEGSDEEAEGAACRHAKHARTHRPRYLKKEREDWGRREEERKKRSELANERGKQRDVGDRRMGGWMD